MVKISQLQKGLGKPHFASRSSETSHSIGFFSVLNLKTEKKPFRNFKPIESGHLSELKKHFIVFYSERSPDSTVQNCGTTFFPFSNWTMKKNLSNAMSQSFWKQNAAFLSPFKVGWFLPFFGGGQIMGKNRCFLGRQKKIPISCHF